MSSKIICVIPARLDSSRFPKKVLYKFNDKPLLYYTWKSAISTGIFTKVIIAIDNKITEDVVSTFTNDYVYTSKNCNSGTERLLEIYKLYDYIDGDIWVNWQCDQPFVNEGLINALLKNNSDNIDVWTLKTKILNTVDIYNPNIVKVVCDKYNKGLYFSRSTIPYSNNKASINNNFYKHIGIYAFKSNTLLKMCSNNYINNSKLEFLEKLEQLTFLYNGLHINVETCVDLQNLSFGVDTFLDIDKFIKKYNKVSPSSSG